MKKQLTLLSALLCSMLMAQTIAVVDVDTVLEHHPNTKGDRQTLELTIEEYATERDALLADIKKREEELEALAKQMQNPMLAQTKIAELQKKGETLFAELNQVKQNAELQVAKRRKDLQELDTRLVRRSTKDVVEKIDAYAKEKGYDIILDKRNVPFVKATYDVTNDIIIRCGGTLPKETPVTEEKNLEQPAKVSTK
ncbi:MAG: OmpH family outer membrane protein [bacterium]|nr:OmpH family outer membrane protein [bacterium]